MRIGRIPGGLLGVAAAVAVVVVPFLGKKLKPVARKVGEGLSKFGNEVEEEPEPVATGPAATKAAEAKRKREAEAKADSTAKPKTKPAAKPRTSARAKPASKPRAKPKPKAKS